MKPRVLHIIPNLGLGGAQRTVATLCKAQNLESRVDHCGESPPPSISWADVVVIHGWRGRKESPELNLPRWVKDITNRRIIVFNHDWEGRYEGAANIVLVYSTFAAAHWSGSQRVAVLPGGITLDRFLRVANSRNWSAVATIGRLSTLQPGKISTRTLSYWLHLEAGLFLVGGGGSELVTLRETFANFRFVGEIRPSRTHEFLAQVDIFLYDTEWHVESFCYVVLEALAAGCVVVASRRGSIPELVDHGVNGFLFDVPDEAVGICNQLLRSPEKCRALSNAGTITARHYPSGQMRLKFTEYVMEILQERNP